MRIVAGFATPRVALPVPASANSAFVTDAVTSATEQLYFTVPNPVA
jgi:hypothetical protein